MARIKEQILPAFDRQKAFSFGGACSARGNPRAARPVVTKRPMHVVMRSSLARGHFSLWMHHRALVECCLRQGRRFGVKVIDFTNAGNHIHLIVQARSREAYRGFIRAVAGLVPRIVLRVEKGRSLVGEFPQWKERESVGFWDARPFTRVVEWGRDFNALKRYLVFNRAGMQGLLRLSAREMLKEVFRLQVENRLVAVGYEI